MNFDERFLLKYKSSILLLIIITSFVFIILYIDEVRSHHSFGKGNYGEGVGVEIATIFAVLTIVNAIMLLIYSRLHNIFIVQLIEFIFIGANVLTKGVFIIFVILPIIGSGFKDFSLNLSFFYITLPLAFDFYMIYILYYINNYK